MTRCRLAAVVLALFAVGACTDRGPTVPPINAAPGGGGPSVNAADPNNAPQDTTLDVRVLGSGFDKGSRAEWAIAGVPSSKVRTNSTRFVSSKELVANITIALDAEPVLYDLLVTTAGGKKGIGTELFAVRLKGSAVGQQAPDPRIAFYGSGVIQVMNSDGNKLFTVADESWTDSYSNTAWGPGGDGTLANPYHVLFSTDYTRAGRLYVLAVVDVDTVGGVVAGRNHRMISTSEWAVHFAWSPLGDSIVVADGSPQYFPAELHLVAPDGTGEHTVYAAPDSESIRGPAWSADGRYIVFVEQPGGSASRYDTRGDDIKIIDLSTRAVTLLVRFPANTMVRGVDWARKRRALAYATGPYGCGRPPKNCYDQVFLQELDSTLHRVGAPVFIDKGRDPSWAPDDGALVYSGTGLQRYDFATGRVTQLASGTDPDWRR